MSVLKGSVWGTKVKLRCGWVNKVVMFPHLYCKCRMGAVALRAAELHPLDQCWWDAGGAPMASGWGWWGLSWCQVWSDRQKLWESGSDLWGDLCKDIVCMCLSLSRQSFFNLYSEVLEYQSRKHSAGLQFDLTPQNPQPSSIPENVILRHAWHLVSKKSIAFGCLL